MTRLTPEVYGKIQYALSELARKHYDIACLLDKAPDSICEIVAAIAYRQGLTDALGAEPGEPSSTDTKSAAWYWAGVVAHRAAIQYLIFSRTPGAQP